MTNRRPGSGAISVTRTSAQGSPEGARHAGPPRADDGDHDIRPTTAPTARNTKESRCLNWYTNVGARWDGRAESARRPDGLGRFFFPGVPEEAATFTSTWMRPLLKFEVF